MRTPARQGYHSGTRADDDRLFDLADRLGADAGALPEGPRRPRDGSSHVIAGDHQACILCERCVRACDEVQGAFALTATGRGFSANVTAGLDSGFEDSTCVSCGACADTCPTDAITEHLLLDLTAHGATTGGEGGNAA